MALALLNNFNPQDGEDSPSTVVSKRARKITVTYSKIVTPQHPPQPLQSSLSTLTDKDKLYESLSLRFGEQFGSKVSITEIEKQVNQTLTEITTIRTSFTEQLMSIQDSVNQLTTKVNNQYHEMSHTVQSLVDTIAKQNFIIAGIQQEFKLSMETLSKTLLTNHTIPHTSSPTSSPRRSPTSG
jgi:NAD-specific glutamate dehydrogenase